MDKDNLLNKQKELNSQFENISKQRNDLDVQLILLRGEYNAYDKLIKELDTPSPVLPTDTVSEPSGFPDNTVPKDPTKIVVKDGEVNA